MGTANASRIVIVGAGLAGAAAALVLASRGEAVTLVGPPPDGTDTRTTALLSGSIDVLREAGVWHDTPPQAAPLRTMAIVDATRRLVRARPLSFRSDEIGLDAFGWNIANGDLARLLETALAAHAGVTRIADRVAAVSVRDDGVTLSLESGVIFEAALAVAADGRRSALREAAGITVRRWRYSQAALALTLSHDRPHDDVSTEFHTEAGPFTLVPLPGRRSSLVWSLAPRDAERLHALPDRALAETAERQCQSMLGRMAVEGGRSRWPMEGLLAASMGTRRIALVGEAAHAFPPIGAQGFNLTIRDLVALADAVAGQPDPGGPAALARYGLARRADVASRTFAVDLLNRSLLTPFLPVQMLRGAGFDLLAGIGPLRRAAMRQGLAPGGTLGLAADIPPPAP